MHVEVKEPYLGVRDLGERLAVHPHELEKGHERKARLHDGGHVAQGLHVVVGELVETRGGQAEAYPEALDQLRLQARLAGRLLERAPLLGAGEDLLDVAIGQPALLTGLPDLSKPMAALAQPRDDAGVRHSRAGPLAAAVHLWDHAGAGPAAQGGGGHPHSLGGLFE